MALRKFMPQLPRALSLLLLLACVDRCRYAGQCCRYMEHQGER